MIIKAKMFCPKHGKLEFSEIMIRNGTPLCSKCSTELVFGNVRPRFDVNGGKKETKESN